MHIVQGLGHVKGEAIPAEHVAVREVACRSELPCYHMVNHVLTAMCSHLLRPGTPLFSVSSLLCATDVVSDDDMHTQSLVHMF